MGSLPATGRDDKLNPRLCCNPRSTPACVECLWQCGSAALLWLVGLAMRSTSFGSACLQATSSTVKVFGLGSWFCPCQWDDAVCHNRIDEMRANGTLRSNLVGHHRYSGSWTPTKHGMYREEVRRAPPPPPPPPPPRALKPLSVGMDNCLNASPVPPPVHGKRPLYICF